MPPRRKSFQTIFMEAVLFVSLFALVGHISLNFWERYVVQKEIVQMKTSLHTLKQTIHHIGIAYNQLYTDLKGLADIAEGGTATLTDLKGLADIAEGGKAKLNIARENQVTDKPRHKDATKKYLQNVQVRAMVDGGVDENTISEKTQTAENKVTQLNTTMSLPRVPPSKVGKKDKKLHHGVEHIHIKTINNKEMKNAATATRNPSKSIAASTDETEKILGPISTRIKSQPGRENIHKCHDDDFCTTIEQPKIDFPRF